MIKAILFDLDGTLLPMDQDVFVKKYLELLTEKSISYGYKPESIAQTIWQGTYYMIKNDGSSTNEEIFWDVFTKNHGKEALKDKFIFDD